MSARDLASALVRLLGWFLFVGSAADLVKTGVWIALPDTVGMPAIPAAPHAILAAIGLLFLRQPDWIGGWLTPRRGEGVDIELPLGSVRAFGYGVMGTLSALAAVDQGIQLTWASPYGIPQAVSVYALIGYALLAISLLFGPLRMMRVVRGLPVRLGPWIPGGIDRAELEGLGFGLLGTSFAVSSGLGAIDLVDATWDSFTIADASQTAALAVLALYLLWRARRTIRRTSTWEVVFELIAVFALYRVVLSVASLLVLGPKGFYAGAFRLQSWHQLAAVIAVAALLLVQAVRLRRRRREEGDTPEVRAFG